MKSSLGGAGSPVEKVAAQTRSVGHVQSMAQAQSSSPVLESTRVVEPSGTAPVVTGGPGGFVIEESESSPQPNGVAIPAPSASHAIAAYARFIGRTIVEVKHRLLAV